MVTIAAIEKIVAATSDVPRHQYTLSPQSIVSPSDCARKISQGVSTYVANNTFEMPSGYFTASSNSQMPIDVMTDAALLFMNDEIITAYDTNANCGARCNANPMRYARSMAPLVNNISPPYSTPDADPKDNAIAHAVKPTSRLNTIA